MRRVTKAQAYGDLAGAILEQASHRWLRKNLIREAREELICFYMSEYFILLCGLARVDDEWLLNILKIRSKYIDEQPTEVRSTQRNYRGY